MGCVCVYLAMHFPLCRVNLLIRAHTVPEFDPNCASCRIYIIVMNINLLSSNRRFLVPRNTVMLTRGRVLGLRSLRRKNVIMHVVYLFELERTLSRLTQEVSRLIYNYNTITVCPPS